MEIVEVIQKVKLFGVEIKEGDRIAIKFCDDTTIVGEIYELNVGNLLMSIEISSINQTIDIDLEEEAVMESIVSIENISAMTKTNKSL